MERTSLMTAATGLLPSLGLQVAVVVGEPQSQNHVRSQLRNWRVRDEKASRHKGVPVKITKSPGSPQPRDMNPIKKGMEWPLLKNFRSQGYEQLEAGC